MAVDFGDAPLPYPTLIAENGAQHTTGGALKLGATVDSEANGAHSAAAIADGADEDGVTFGTIRVGQLDATVTVTVSGGSGKLDAWIDFDGDGSWGGLGEQIFASQDVIAGTNTLTFNVPGFANPRATYARFRLSSAGALGPKGLAANGEVEDYQITIAPPVAGTGVFGDRGLGIAGDGARSVATADIDGDGDLDIAYASSLSRRIGWLKNDGNENYTEIVISAAQNSGDNVFAVDMDGDGDIDLLSQNQPQQKVTWFENDGNENFTARLVGTGITNDSIIVAADLDQDGDMDVLSPNTTALVWYENNGSQGFTARSVASGSGRVRAVTVSDVDSDGDLDIISGSDLGFYLNWYENNGSGSFTTRTLVAGGSHTVFSVFGVDLDNDGDTDILSTSFLSNAVYWHENDGNQNFTVHTIAQNVQFSRMATPADLDGDGDMDIIGDGFADGRVTWYQNDGDGNFTPVAISGAGNNIFDQSVADMDGDGDLDVLTASFAWRKQNNAPVVTQNAIAVTEGGNAILSSANLNAADVDDSPALLRWTVSGVTGGRFELTTAPGVAIPNFTQAQVNSGVVRFVHDGGETAPTYTLTLGDGISSAPVSAGNVTFTNVNDAPVISTNTLAITEGAALVLNSTRLNATDPDNTTAQLTYSVTSVAGGQFELVAAAGVAITSFTQAQINSSAVRFLHNGGEIAPTYSLTVSDGTATSSPSTPGVTFTNLNDAPVIAVNSLTIAEGGTVSLGSGNLTAADPDNTPAQLAFTASNVTGGRFALASAPGTAVTTFTQAQVNAGQIVFVHLGSETAPSYSLTVSDGSITSAASTGAITFTNVNDAPVISVNAFSIAEGASLVLSTGQISSTDPDNTPAQLTFTASVVSGGRFELVAAPGISIAGFTQAQINSGAVRFVHDGGEATAAYSLTVSDGSLSSAASAGAVGFTNVNDAPVISANAISVAEGDTVVLGTSNLNALDPDNASAQLTYTITAVGGGKFEFISNSGVAINSFTQAQISSGAVQFVHNGSENAPSYTVTVSDSMATSGTSTGVVTFTSVNDPPVITVNAISVVEGSGLILGSSNISASDPDNPPAALVYSVSGVTGGQFEFLASPGAGITTFTQAQINIGAVRFLHDGGEASPAYTLTVSDGLDSSAITPAVVTFTNTNDAPVVSVNLLAIAEGASVVLGSGNLAATDADNTPAQLTYSVSGVSGGQFESVTAPGAAITTFTQAQINGGGIRFVHDGGEAAPGFSLTASDGLLTSVVSNPAVTFSSVNDAPVITVNAIAIDQGATLPLSSANIDSLDPDNSPAQLIYTTSGVTGGRLEFVVAPGTAITSFSQAQINAGAVRFVHDGSEIPPAYSLTVTDGIAPPSDPSVATVTFQDVNDPPVISTNAIAIAEGAAILLSNSNIAAIDPDNTPAELTFTASNVVGGRFEFVAAPGIAITTFTQAQINAGAVRFVHNGSESGPGYSLTVSDGTVSSAISAPVVIFSPVNDAPLLAANTITIAEGAALILGSGNINATDPDNTPAQLTYSANDIAGGQFELTGTPGFAITSFTQAQIESGSVRFVHNGGEMGPSYVLVVSDGTVFSATSNANVTFSNVNDAPSLTTNTITITEGATLVLGDGHINATDPDNSPAQLVYNVSSVTGGRFAAASAPGIAISSFNQAQISAGQIVFVHDGGEAAPSYSLAVSDGVITSSLSVPTVNFTNVNDAPVISSNALTISEGAAVTLGNGNINASDPDNSPAHLTYSASDVSGGQFEFVASPGAAILNFTQAQISSGAVRFVHNGDEGTAAYSLVVSDSLVSSTASIANVSYTNVNDAPVISMNVLSITEGAMLTLGSGNINSNDPDNTAAQLTYTVANLAGGRFELITAPGTAVTTFTQSQINAGDVQFVHNGAEAAPNYSLTVSDGSISSTASSSTVSFANVNDAPVITSNAISIGEGGTLTLGNGNLNTTDPDNTPAQLSYTATNLTGGRFELVTAPGTVITSFTQAQISGGAVQFVHNGDEGAPSYSLTVSDGSLSSTASTSAVSFTNVNDAPAISSNSITIAEGATATLGSVNLNVTDPDNTPSQLFYTASGISGGHFALAGSPGAAITSFTQAQINAGQVVFVHNGGESGPGYSLTVSDGGLSSAVSSSTVSFNNVNDAPVITANSFSIAEGGIIVLGSANFNATDPDNSAGQLIYTASNVTGGQFEPITNPGVAITSFTQAEINAGNIRFVHDGGEMAPTFTLTLSDGVVSTSPQNTGGGTFTNINDQAPVFTSSANRTLAENGTSVGNVTATDADLPSQTVTYSITGGTDAAKFTITPSGLLSFVTAPDFEAPSDVGGNNLYEVQITANDGSGLSTVQSLSVTVTDVGDGVVAGVTLQGRVLRITGTDGNDVIGVVQLFGYYVVATTMAPYLTTFRVSEVDRMEVDLRDGNDVGIIGPFVDVSTTLDGGNGNDVLVGAFGDTTISGGAGDDVITAGCANNTIDAGSGNDFVYGGSGNDTILGGDGNDVVDGAGGIDIIDGGSGNDAIYGGDGSDILRGGDGNDCLYGEGGADILLGGTGVDSLFGGSGRDVLIGGGGGDQIRGESDDDILIGGATIFDNSNAALLSILAEWNSSRSYDQRVKNLRGTGSESRLNGTSFLTNSTVTNDTAADVLYGAGGQDWFWATTGQDQVTDKASNEKLN